MKHLKYIMIYTRTLYTDTFQSHKFVILYMSRNFMYQYVYTRTCRSLPNLQLYALANIPYMVHVDFVSSETKPE